MFASSVVSQEILEEKWYWNISKNKFILYYKRKLELVAFLSLSHLMQFFFCVCFSIYSFLSLSLRPSPSDEEVNFASLAFSRQGNRLETEHQKIIALRQLHKFFLSLFYRSKLLSNSHEKRYWGLFFRIFQGCLWINHVCFSLFQKLSTHN